MDVGLLSIAMSQSRVKESAGIALLKIAMDTVRTDAVQTIEIVKSTSTDTNLGNNLDVRI